jgi:hypothetical protein
MVTLREYYQKKRDFYGIDQLGILVIAYKFGLLVECLASKPARLRELREPFSMPAGPCFWLGTAIAIVGGGIALASYLWKPLCERRFMRDSVGRQTIREVVHHVSTLPGRNFMVIEKVDYSAVAAPSSTP